MTIYILQHGLRNLNTHFYSETAEYIKAIRSLGLDYKLYVHHTCEPDIVEKFQAHPVFPYTPEALVETDPSIKELANYISCGEAFASVLLKELPRTFNENDLVFVPYGSQNEAYGLMRWLRLAKIQSFPKIAIFCHRPELVWELSEDRTKLSGNSFFWRWPGRFLNQSVAGLPRCIVVTYGKPLAKVLQKYSELSTLVTGLTTSLPVALSDALATPKDIDVGMMGTFRPERGSKILVSALLEIDRTRPGLTYLVQIGSDEEQQHLTDHLKSEGFKGHLHHAVGDLSTEAYTAHLLRCRLLILPYRRYRYALRGSGVMSEAASYGIPVVVPSQTWLSDCIDRQEASGLVFGEETPQSIAASVVTALDQLPALTQHAVAKAPAWCAKHNALSNLKAILQTLGIPHDDTRSA